MTQVQPTVSEVSYTILTIPTNNSPKPQSI